MIRLQDRTPSVLSRDSRDYQLVCRIFDSCINTSKVAADSILNINSKNLDYRFIDLACKTLGFNYNNEHTYAELIRVIQSFKEIMFKKGSREAIEKTLNLVLNSQGIRKTFYISEGDWTGSDKILNIILPIETKDTTLIDDIFEYILPAGWLYTISKAEIETTTINPVEIISTDSSRKRYITDKQVAIKNYIGVDSEGVLIPEDVTDVARVPLDVNKKFVSPAVNFDTVISLPSQLEDE